MPELPKLAPFSLLDSGALESGNHGVSCSQGCGELFCSFSCEERAQGGGHSLLCVGPLESINHPLVKFRQLCGELGEEVLVAGLLVAAALTEMRIHDGCAGPATLTARALIARSRRNGEIILGENEEATVNAVEEHEWEAEALDLLLKGLQEAHGIQEASVHAVLMQPFADPLALPVLWRRLLRQVFLLSLFKFTVTMPN